jgi:AraC-like DNA-binding protein
MIPDQLTLSIPEIASLIGLSQCVYVLVYMLFRSGDPRRAAVPFVYFSILGIAFFMDFAAGYVGTMWESYPVLQWAFWFYGPPLSVLLLIQVAQINKMPSLASFWVLLLIPLSYGIAYSFADGSVLCNESIYRCQIFYDWLILTGLLSGAISMMAMWTLRHIMHDLYALKEGQARYWLIITLIIINLMYMSIMLLSMTPYVLPADAELIRTILGIAFVYLAGTSLFRIYPQALVLVTRAEKKAGMSDDEKAIAQKIESLLALEKIYHEPAYGRKDLARELNVSESIISKVINVYFGKNFPQLLNERRVEDAKLLLVETEETIKIICDEVGFNSVPSFNRVFREMTGVTPTDFREENQQIEPKKA